MSKTIAPKISINPSERVYLAGMTGSGKTTLARSFLANVNRLVVIDTKFNLDPDEWQAQIVRDVPRLPADGDGRYIVRSEDPEALGAGLLRLRDYYLYVDEIFSVFPSALKASREWRSIWTAGREFNIGVWAGSQRPTMIPNVIKTEANHYFIFRLQLPEDRQTMRGIVGIDIPRLRGHEFIYANPATETYLQVKQLKASE